MMRVGPVNRTDVVVDWRFDELLLLLMAVDAATIEAGIMVAVNVVVEEPAVKGTVASSLNIGPSSSSSSSSTSSSSSSASSMSVSSLSL